MAATSALCLLKLPLDFLLSVEPAVLQRDKNTFGTFIFQNVLCVSLALLTIINCRSELALHSTLTSDKAATVPCMYIANRTICSYCLLKKEWCRKMNCKYSEKDYKALKLTFSTLKMSQ